MKKVLLAACIAFFCVSPSWADCGFLTLCPRGTSGGSGDVVGPASSTNGQFALFDGVTGKLLKGGSLFGVTSAGSEATPDLASSGNHLYIGTTSAHVIQLVTNAVKRFQIAANGNLIDANGSGGSATIQYNKFGSATEPTYSFTGDLNTGVYWASADVLGFAAGGVQVAQATATTLKASLSFTATPLASPPFTCAAGVEGSIYADTSHALCFCDGTSWNVLTGSGAGSCA